MVKPGRDDGGYSSIPGMDPRADWLLGPGLQYFMPPGGDGLIPFTIQVEDEAALRVLNELLRAPGLRDDPEAISAGREWRRRPDAVPGQTVVAYARKGFFDELARRSEHLEPLRAGVKRIQLGLPMPAASFAAWDGAPEPRVSPPERPWPEKTVVIGVIDDGIAFAHQRFRTPDTSRVEAYWNQDGEFDPAGAVDYGRELVRQDINTLLQDCSQDGWVDEDKLYRRAGLIDFTRPFHPALAWRAAHGTHVLDLAAGEDPADEVANRPIIAVQLRVATTAAQSGPGLETDVINALTYIRDRALLLTRPGEPPLPVVINFSYGTHAGPHDGTSPIERAIEDILADQPQMRVVLPAGNSHSSRCHAAVAFAAKNDTVELHLRVQPDDQTPSGIEIWLPHAGSTGPAQSRISLSVEAPDGTTSGWIGEVAGSSLILGPANDPYCLGTYAFVAVDTERGVFRLDLLPTSRVLPQPEPAFGPPSMSTAPAGLWVIRLRNTALTPEDTVHAWIERDDKMYGYPRRGRQSYFDEGCYKRWDEQGRPVEEDADPAKCLVQRARMLNGIGSGLTPVVIGGYVLKDLKVTRYSAGGPITPAKGGQPNDGLRKPDAVAVSDDSRVHGGVLGAGSRSGSTLAMNGTSVAAPQVTRELANQLAEGEPANRAAVRQWAQDSEVALPPGSPKLPPERGGWGRLPAVRPQGARARFWR